MRTPDISAKQHPERNGCRIPRQQLSHELRREGEGHTPRRLPKCTSSCRLTMNRPVASRTARYPFPTFSAEVDHIAVSTPSTKGVCFIDPRVDRNSSPFPTRHLRQVLRCPPSVGFFPAAIVPNLTRLGIRSLFFPCHGP